MKRMPSSLPSRLPVRMIFPAALFLLVLAGTAVTPFLPAQEASQDATPASEELLPQVRRQLRRLNDAQLANREAAEQALITLGPEILPLLPEASPQMPAETKHRLGRVREKLLRAKFEASLEPSYLTLSGEKPSLSDIAAAIEKQTGNKVIDYRENFGGPAGEVSLDVDIEKGEFWPTVDRLLDQANLSLYNYSGEQALALINRPAGVAARRERASYHGPFRIEPVRVTATRDLRNPVGQALTIDIEISWEPRLAPIAVTLPLESIEAETLDKKMIPVANPEVQLEIPVQTGTTAAQLELPLKLPPRDARQISSLSGVLTILVPGEVTKFRFDELSEAVEGAEQQQGGTIVVLESIRANDDLWEVRMKVGFDKTSGALESHRGWVFNNAAYLVDADGKRIDNVGLETTLQTEHEVGFAYFFERRGQLAGKSFVYETPAAILNVPVPFQLKNIPLP